MKPFAVDTINIKLSDANVRFINILMSEAEFKKRLHEKCSAVPKTRIDSIKYEQDDFTNYFITMPKQVTAMLSVYVRSKDRITIKYLVGKNQPLSLKIAKAIFYDEPIRTSTKRNA
jgi:hypothetical protein